MFPVEIGKELPRRRVRADPRQSVEPWREARMLTLSAPGVGWNSFLLSGLGFGGLEMKGQDCASEDAKQVLMTTRDLRAICISWFKRSCPWDARVKLIAKLE